MTRLGDLNDDSMSSGDEEDDVSTASYQSDSEDDGGMNTGNLSFDMLKELCVADPYDVWPHGRDYRTALRRYQSRYLTHPSFWHESPYYLARVSYASLIKCWI
jgi:hypothetical protein